MMTVTTTPDVIWLLLALFNPAPGALRGGVAKLHGRLVRLAAPPDLGMRYVAVDYIPEMGLRQIMPYGCGWRDMTDDEVAQADQVLRAICAPSTA